MRPTSISVVIPAYNAAAYIGDTLQSVFEQTLLPNEVIVVDDGSSDETVESAAVAPYRHRIVYIRQQNGGASAARNTGIRAARSEWIALLDADDVWRPRCLESQLDCMYTSGAELVYGDAEILGSELHGRRYMDVCPSDGPVTLEALIARRCHVMVSVLAKRSCLIDAGLFAPAVRRCEDFEMWCRYLLTGHTIAYHREVIMQYRRQGQGKSASEQCRLEGIMDIYERLLQGGVLTSRERDAALRMLASFRERLNVVVAKECFQQRDYSRAAHLLGTACWRQPKLLAARLAAQALASVAGIGSLSKVSVKNRAAI